MSTEDKSADPGFQVISPEAEKNDLVAWEETEPITEALDENQAKLLAILKQQGDLSLASITKTFEGKYNTRIEMQRELKVKDDNLTLKENMTAEGTGNERDEDEVKGEGETKWTNQNTIELFAGIGTLVVIVSCIYGIGSLLAKLFKN